MTQVFCLSGLGRLQGGQKGKGIWLPPGIYTQGQLSSLRAPKQAGARRRGAAVENRRTWAPRRCGNRSRGCVREPPPARTPQPRRLVTHGRDPRLQTRVTGTRVPKKKTVQNAGHTTEERAKGPRGQGNGHTARPLQPGEGRGWRGEAAAGGPQAGEAHAAGRDRCAEGRSGAPLGPTDSVSPAAAALATMRQVGLPSRSDMARGAAEPGGGGGGRLLMRPPGACAVRGEPGRTGGRARRPLGEARGAA